MLRHVGSASVHVDADLLRARNSGCGTASNRRREAASLLRVLRHTGSLRLCARFAARFAPAHPQIGMGSYVHTPARILIFSSRRLGLQSKPRASWA
jgi:hypothetical protein